MANALIPNEITLWFKTKEAVDPETGEETKAVLRQPSLGWNIGDGVLGIFVSENQLYMVPLAELEGILVEYTDEEEDSDDSGVADEALSVGASGDSDSSTEADDSPKAKVYVPNFGGGSKSDEGGKG